MIKEILTEVLCRLLDASKNKFIEYLAEYILNCSYFTQLIDEYAAHDVEGRFTVFGYQDYSSFKQIELSLKDEIGAEEVEITRSIGNNFAFEIKDGALPVVLQT
jgi:hypothetical protein